MVQAVNVAVVLNYVTQCASLRFLIINMTYKLQDRTTTLKAAMKGMKSVNDATHGTVCKPFLPWLCCHMDMR